MSSPSLESTLHCLEITAWQNALLPPPLLAGELHLWKLDDPERPPTSPQPDSLSSAERKRAQNFRNPQAHDTFVQSRRAMRHILGGYLGIEPGEVRFAEGPHGKPCIGNPGARLQFNLTHSGRLCLLAVTSGVAVGVDTEQIRERRSLLAIAERMFDPEWVQQLRSLPEPQLLRRFYGYWTWMEAVVAQGTAAFVSMSRPFIREPFLVRRLREGRTDRAACINCNLCLAAMFNGRPVRCFSRQAED